MILSSSLISHDPLQEYRACRPNLKLSIGYISEEREVFLSPKTSSTYYEISSLTKLFTSIVLCQLLREDRLSLDQPIEEILPELKRKVRGITIYDLVTHTAGYPMMPFRFYLSQMFSPSNSMNSLNTKRLLKSLSMYRFGLSEKRFRYSHLGYILLRLCLENVVQEDFSTIIQKRILTPLNMKETGTVREFHEKIAPGYARGKKQPIWYSDSMLGAIGYVSTLADMMKFLHSLVEGEFVQEVRMATEIQIPNAIDIGIHGGLGWLIDERRGIAWLSGDTAGFSAFLGISLQDTKGIIILSNYGKDGLAGDVQEIGFSWISNK